MDLKSFLKPYLVADGAKFRLKDIDPGDTQGLSLDKGEAQDLLRQGTELLAKLQGVLYAQERWSLLLIFQAMDAAGKDGVIKHVMSGVNPQGVQVTSFKQPSVEELRHDYLWRYHKASPERGWIGIFNRSYYEEVLVVRVEKGVLQAQHLPAELVTDQIWDERLKDIRRHERYLIRNGTIIRKFFLHLSKEEQKKRFLDRLEEPIKNWKFSSADLQSRSHWDEYMAAYESAIQATATKAAPWYVVPADNKWFTRLIVAGAVIEALEDLELSYPAMTPEQHERLAEARHLLENEKR